MHLLLVRPYDPVVLALEHVVDDAKEHAHVVEQLGGYALACGVDGNLASSAGKHERCCKHAHADCLPKPVHAFM